MAKTCVTCGIELPPRVGPGRPRKYCAECAPKIRPKAVPEAEIRVHAPAPLPHDGDIKAPESTILRLEMGGGERGSIREAPTDDDSTHTT